MRGVERIMRAKRCMEVLFKNDVLFRCLHLTRMTRMTMTTKPIKEMRIIHVIMKVTRHGVYFFKERDSKGNKRLSPRGFEHHHHPRGLPRG